MTSSTKSGGRSWRPVLLGLSLGLVIGAWYYRAPLRTGVSSRLILANVAPPPEVVVGMIRDASEPETAILAAWASGKIIHRQVAIDELTFSLREDTTLSEPLERILQTGALDPDSNVRYAAFRGLRTLGHPDRAPLALAQLADPDQERRLLGLDHLRQISPEAGIPNVMPLLDDADPMVVATSLKMLETWTGQSFGARIADATPVLNHETGLLETGPEGAAVVWMGADRAQAWWAENQATFPPVSLPVPDAVANGRPSIPAPDFALRTLEGDRVRLSDLRGKVVLINFWTTWCAACIGEMPVLVELQKRFGDELVILGISLDYVPDSHGHIGGHAAVEDQHHSDGHHDDRESTAAARKRVRAKIERIAHSRGINYPVLLDVNNDAGGRYHGGELPTTVIVDTDGWVRRRFVGTRTLMVFEAMIAEAVQPR